MIVQVLINTLADSKTTSSIIKERVEESEKTEVEIDLARKKYTPVATRGSIIYFVIADLSGIDPMYQYSLQYYQTLFDRCVVSWCPPRQIPLPSIVRSVPPNRRRALVATRSVHIGLR